MNWKRLTTIVSLGGAVGAWFSSAVSVPGPQNVKPSGRSTPLTIESRGAELASEVTRLHERLRPDVAPRQPARNLFTFHSAPRVAPSATVALPAPTPASPAQPSLTLAGIAEDAKPEGPERTAVISGEGQLFLVKEGESVTARYRVAKVTENSVELTDTTDGSTRRLSLK